MKRFVPLGLAVAIVLTAIAVGSPAEVDAQGAGLVSSILNRMERNHRDLKSLRAGISMEKYDAAIKDSDKYTGTVLYVPATGRNAFVRVDWQKPQHEILSVANGQYTLFRPRLNMAWVGNANSKRARANGALDFLSMSRQQLMSSYDFQDSYDETLWGGVQTNHLKLVPKVNAPFKYAEVWVDQGGMPVQTKVVEKNDDSTTVRLLNMQKNASISLDEFNIKLDSNVKKVRG
ncbi:MAG: outer membrane lipoprotein carrier protein LolA [Pyrinomonadaceae bacterium]